MRRRACVPCCLLFLLAPASITTAQTSDDSDIVVTGNRIRIQAGLWEFRRYPTIQFQSNDGPVRRPPTISRGFQWTRCIPDADLEASVLRLLGDPPEQPAVIGCTKMRVAMDGGKINGAKSCSRFGNQTSWRLSGKISETTLDVTGRSESETRDSSLSENQWRLTGRRIHATCTPTG